MIARNGGTYVGYFGMFLSCSREHNPRGQLDVVRDHPQGYEIAEVDGQAAGDKPDFMPAGGHPDALKLLTGFTSFPSVVSRLNARASASEIAAWRVSHHGVTSRCSP
jgi:hypothetical protein